MKKIFAFAIALVSMAVSMVSCNNDDAEFIEQPAPVAVQQHETKMMDIDFVVAVTDVQQDYLDEAYVIEFSGRQFTVALSDMKPANAVQMAAFDDAKAVANAYDIESVKYYAFNLGQVSSYEAAKIVRHNVEVKADHPTEEANFLTAACFVVNGRVTSNLRNVELYTGIYGNDQDLNGFAEKEMERRY